MKIERALVIRDPWVEYIFENEKIWEMRARKPPTNLLGRRIGIIRQGTSTIVGEATLYQPETIRIESPEEFKHTFLKHRIVFDSDTWDKWLYPWGLRDAIKYADPVPYVHPRGAVVWVKV